MDEEQQHHAFIQQFCNVTASSPQQARFFLESSSWQLEPALQHFFEASDSGLAMDPDAPEPQHEAPAPAADHRRSSQLNQPSPPPPSGPFQGVGAFPRSNNQSISSSGGPKPAKNKQQASGSRGGVRTLSDLSSPPADSDSDSDGPVEYYTGGEKSGMLVQDPSKGHKDVDAIFDRARQIGAQEGPLEPPQAPSNSRTAFTGIGRTLAGDIQQPQVEGPRSRPQLDPVVRSITFWRNGFTVDDGPLRRLDDPANAQFLANISKSECPKELEPADRGTPVHVNLIRKDEDWQPPLEPKVVPFRGVGRTLGSSSTPDTGSASSPVASHQPSRGLVVDNSNPVTSIQLRLSDGTRLVARFNHYHTVADIRGFIDAARPGNARNYQLQTMGFPPKALTDLTQTIEQAGLINAVVIQKA